MKKENKKPPVVAVADGETGATTQDVETVVNTEKPEIMEDATVEDAEKEEEEPTEKVEEKKFYTTSDGQIFPLLNDAQNHAATLQDKEIN